MLLTSGLIGGNLRSMKMAPFCHCESCTIFEISDVNEHCDLEILVMGATYLANLCTTCRPIRRWNLQTRWQFAFTFIQFYTASSGKKRYLVNMCVMVVQSHSSHRNWLTSFESPYAICHFSSLSLWLFLCLFAYVCYVFSIKTVYTVSI